MHRIYQWKGRASTTKKIDEFHPCHPIINDDTKKKPAPVIVYDPQCFIEVPHGALPMHQGKPKVYHCDDSTSHVIDDRLEPITLKSTITMLKESEAR